MGSHINFVDPNLEFNTIRYGWCQPIVKGAGGGGGGGGGVFIKISSKLTF